MNGGVLNIQTTTKCTLKCRDCSWHFSMFTPSVDSDLELNIRSLKKAFELFDYINECRIGGGEAFFYPGLERLMVEAEKYSNKFGKLSIITNGSYIPKESMLRAFADLECEKFIRVDDYGALSPKAKELAELLEKEYKITVDYRPYNEEEMSFGGWVDLGNFEPIKRTDEQLTEVFEKCRIPADCLCIWDGKLFNCTYSASGYMLGRYDVGSHEYVDLINQTLEEQRSTLNNWNKVPLTGCKYCLGFDPDTSPRIPAAIQGD